MENVADIFVLLVVWLWIHVKVNHVKVRSYIAPVLGAVQSALHFIRWHTCSFHFDLSGKHSATQQLLREDYSFKYPPLSVSMYSFIQLSEMWQRGMNEIANASKRQREYSNPGSFD